MLFDCLLYRYKFYTFSKKWRKRNSHNYCEVQTIFDMDRVCIGNKTYGMINPHLYNTKSRIYIGSYCSIAENVHFILGEHDYTKFSTYPFNAFINNTEKEIPKTKGDIIIEDDVWIGMNSTILSGVKIHQGAVIGAGSVVSKDIPPYAIFAGGGVVKYRFPQNIIDKLLNVDYEKISEKFVIDNYKLLSGDIAEFIIDESFLEICKKD